MRRVAASLSALLLLATFGLTQADAAHAATGSLTVVTIGRDGLAVATSPVVVNTKTSAIYYLKSGQSKTLPVGVYDVMVDVWNSRDGTDTLGAKQVNLSGTSSVTIDARAGRAIGATLSPPAPSGYQQHFNMALCTSAGLPAVLGWTLGSVLYVIPVSLPTVTTAFSAIWAPVLAGPQILASTEHVGGVPSGGTVAFDKAGLTTLKVTAQSGPQEGDATIELDSRSSAGCRDAVTQLRTSATLPVSFDALVPAGRWSMIESAQDVSANYPRTYLAGHTYNLVINHAAWGPSGQLPYVRAGDHLLYINTPEMFADPFLDSGVGASNSYRLSFAGRTILSSTTTQDTTTLSPVISSRGWYTLTVVAKRAPRQPLPADVLSTVSSLVMHFYADPNLSDQVKGYLTRFVPVSLNRYNRAQPGTSTTVNLGLERVAPYDSDIRQLPDSVASVKAWASADGGRTWRLLVVTHSGSSWSAKVSNGQFGYMSLRATVTDTSGSTTTTTVYRAYGLG